jgi:DegV family protein with EDD domain
MMQKIAIVVDSTANLLLEEKTRYFMEPVPINVMFEGKIYQDGVDLTAEQAYAFLEKNPDDWATSAPSPGTFLKVFKNLADRGAESIICLTLLQSASATWNSARIAKESAQKELPGIKIEIIDSGTVASGERLLALKIGRAIEEGKSFEEAIQIAEDYKKRVKFFVLLETLRHIYRSGRVSETAAKIGATLPIKPILSIHGGKLKFFSASLSKKNSEKKVLNILKDEFDENLPEIFLTHISSRAEAEILDKEISAMIPAAKIILGKFSPIMGYAMGPGTIGIGYFAKS